MRWLFGGARSDGPSRHRESSVGGRLDRFVARTTQAVEEQAPANYAVDANYQLIPSTVATSVPRGGDPDRERGILHAARRRLAAGRGSHG